MRNLRPLRFSLAALFFALAALAFSGLWLPATLVARIQAGPIFLQAVATTSKGALAALVTLLLCTLLFGRVFCSFVCPLGTLQDILAFSPKPRATHIPNLRVLRYALAALTYTLLFAGFAAGFLVLDPYTTFGRIATSLSTLSAGGLVTLALLTLLARWKKRLFCTAICPIGTFLGLLSRASLFKLRIPADACIQCFACDRACPTGAILHTTPPTIDSERCILCFQCLSKCPKHGITLSRKSASSPSATPPTDTATASFTRREFLAASLAFVGGTTAGLVLAKSGLAALPRAQTSLTFLPPGAGGAERFASKCTGCGLCIKACPSRILVPPSSGFGPIHLDPTRGACDYNCHQCATVCPTGAIPKLPLPVKQQTPIALASFHAAHCLAFQEGKPCGMCASVCPTQAITLRKSGAPKPVQPSLCIGCGACIHACPGFQGTKALTLKPLSPVEQL